VPKAKKVKKNKKVNKIRKVKIYHDITCNCYGCRVGTTLRAKD